MADERVGAPCPEVLDILHIPCGTLTLFVDDPHIITTLQGGPREHAGGVPGPAVGDCSPALRGLFAL